MSTNADGYDNATNTSNTTNATISMDNFLTISNDVVKNKTSLNSAPLDISPVSPDPHSFSDSPIWFDEFPPSPSTPTSCTVHWPELEIFLPIYLNPNVSVDSLNIRRVMGDVTQKFDRNNEWIDIFMRSFLMFWPVKRSNVKFRLIIDQEFENSTLIPMHVTNFIDSMTSELGDSFPLINITFNAPKQNVYNSGHDRQQYMMFTADKFTLSEHVAFVDTDTLFHSYADVNDMFENGKPIIHGKIQNFGGGKTIKRDWSASTYHFLGEEEPMICMSYFPIIFKTSDLKDLRAFVERRFNKSFDVFFHEKSTFAKWAHYSQFNIMCTYLYWHKRDNYQWYIHDMSPGWNGVSPKPHYGQWADKSVFSREMFQHRPYLATHLDGRYHQGKKTEALVIYHFIHAWCYRNPVYRIKVVANLSAVSREVLRTIKSPEGLKLCSDLKRHKELYNIEMHKFEDADYLYESANPNFTQIVAIHKARYERIRNCNHTYIFI